jgi:hypothetical protein
MVNRVVELGLVEFFEDDAELVARSPSFLEIGSELAALGVPPDVILDRYRRFEMTPLVSPFGSPTCSASICGSRSPKPACPPSASPR